MTEILRYSAFTDTPAGGNPAGVVLDARGLSDERMLEIAADLGYSETAFLIAAGDVGTTFDVRYFSPLAEVPFCGHATIATAVALAERGAAGELLFRTAPGDVPVATSARDGRGPLATLTSVPAHSDPIADEDLDTALRLLRWRRDELDPALPPRVAFAGARHLVLAAATRERLAGLDYDFEGLKAFMLEHDLTTVHLVHRRDAETYDARDPFPVGGTVEDPATGAAAAAFGAYLRDLGLLPSMRRVRITQGEDMGRPSALLVDVPEGQPVVRVSGTAVAID
jgi:PhzF family phenazine biosynthesis protein